MNENSIKSYKNLKDFISHFDLMDRHSNIAFQANVTIKTSKRTLETNSLVRVSFNEYNSPGKLSITETEIDPYKFPEIFDLEWQMFDFVKNEYLKITGEHTKNAEIGKYSVIIYPQ